MSDNPRACANFTCCFLCCCLPHAFRSGLAPSRGGQARAGDAPVTCTWWQTLLWLWLCGGYGVWRHAVMLWRYGYG
jgi:hypothetical protein